MKTRKIIAMYLSAALAAAMFPTTAVSAAEQEVQVDSAETTVVEEIPEAVQTTAVTDVQMPTTMTTKAPPSDELNYDQFRVCVDVHDESNKMVSGIKMRLERVRNEWTSDYSYVTGDDIEVIAEWTTDGTPFWSEPIEVESGKAQYSYYIVADTLPKEYHYYCKDSIKRDVPTGKSGIRSYSLKLGKRKYPDVEFPVTGKFSLTFNIADEEGTPAENLDCEFVDKNTGEVLYAWNTSDESEVTISDLEYKLETEWSGYPCFAVRAKEMPNGYGFKEGEYFRSGTPTECYTYFHVDNFDINVDEYTTTLEISRDVMYTYLPEAIETGTSASTNNDNTTTTTAVEPEEKETETTPDIAPDYPTALEYDDSPMKIGETRAIRFYNPATQKATGADISCASDNIKVSYTDGEDVVLITALAEGAVELYIRESGCAFGRYVSGLTVVADTALAGDANLDGKVTIADAAAILQYLGNKDKYPLSEVGLVNADCDGEKGITVKDAIAVQKKAVG